MELGAFSISLAVKNLQAAKDFYQKLGFSVFAGTAEQHYLIMKNGTAIIGLFEGMFEGNIITFNPGWNQDATDTANFQHDIRAIQSHLQQQQLDLIDTTDPNGTGAGSVTLTDPDGNVILIDQHRQQ